MITLTLPLPTRSETNMREHWSARHRRRRTQRMATALALRGQLAAPELPVVVTLVRIASRALDDDNLRGALKAVRDGVADAFGVDDSDSRIAWRYEQRRGRPRELAVEIRIGRP